MIKPQSCSNCTLYNISQGFMESEGQGNNGVVVVGEYGGHHEYVDALPLRPHASAGSMFEQALRIVAQEVGQPCTRSQFLIYNMINCSPPAGMMENPKYVGDAVACCGDNVDRVVGGFKTNKQKTILAFGNIPLKYLTGVSGIADEKQSISHLRGFVMESKYGLVVPTYNPAFIRRGNSNLTPLLVEDIKRALGVARGTYLNHTFHTGYVPPIYQTAPSIDEAWSFYYKVKDNPKLCLSYDIETAETGSIDEDERDDLADTEIRLVQFSVRKGSGIAFAYNSDYLPIIRKLFALSNPKANHNTWNFDNPRLKAKGINIEGKVHDTMWMFKHWHPKLPRGLQAVASLFGFPFPWKHLYGSNLQWYGCADVDAVQWIIHDLPKLMKARGVWRGYYDHVYRVNPIFERATERGIPVDEGKRIEVNEDFKQRRNDVHIGLQKVIPDEVRNIEPKRKEWVCPKCKGVERTTKKTCTQCGEYTRQEREKGKPSKEVELSDYGYIREPKTVGIEHDKYEGFCERARLLGKQVVPFAEYLYRKHNLTYGEFEGLDKDTGQRIKTSRWCIVEDFKASSTQLIRYLKWKQSELQGEIDNLRLERDEKFGGRNPELTSQIREMEELRDDYEVPISLKTKKETTSHKELEEMYITTGDKVLEMVQEIRSYDTNLNNYLPGWKPKSDGRVHPSYGYTAPQGQINSWRPNSQNVSKHTEFGNEFRGIISAPSGYCFVEADKKSFHVATMGYCANDKDYIRFSQLDPHSILGSYIDPSIIGGSISFKWSDAEIMLAAGEFKKRCKQHKAKDPSHNVDVRQELAKPTVLGNQLELGAKKLQRQNRRFIHTVAGAERLQRIISDIFPRVKLFKKQVKEKAHVEKYLINEWARIQYFYDVFQFSWSNKTRNWVRKEGEGARLPVAFKVQGSAFGMITEELLKCELESMCEEHNFTSTIHDSLIFMPEIGKRDKCIENLARIMSTPCSKLVNDATGPQGLIVGVEVAAGVNWKAYNKDTNPGGMVEIKL